jgi:hypothetical protein
VAPRRPPATSGSQRPTRSRRLKSAASWRSADAAGARSRLPYWPFPSSRHGPGRRFARRSRARRHPRGRHAWDTARQAEIKLRQAVQDVEPAAVSHPRTPVDDGIGMKALPVFAPSRGWRERRAGRWSWSPTRVDRMRGYPPASTQWLRARGLRGWSFGGDISGLESHAPSSSQGGTLTAGPPRSACRGKLRSSYIRARG